MKTTHTCRHCGNTTFKNKPVPRFSVKPPLKVGVLCLKCGETLVISFSDFCDNYLIRAGKIK